MTDMHGIEYVGITVKLNSGEVVKHKIPMEEFVEGHWMGGRLTQLVSDTYDLPYLNSISIRTNLPHGS